MRKKNKILTFLFACIPGAGHMYLGFMKMGLSFMTLFFLIMGLAALADNILYVLTGPILMILPVIWFYTFFDCINKNGASDEEFASYQDHFLFTDIPELNQLKWNPNLFHSRVPRTVVGFILLLSGISMFSRNMLWMLGWDYDNLIYRILSRFFDYLPQVAISLAVIALGIWLIAGKRRELKREYQEIKELSEHHES